MVNKSLLLFLLFLTLPACTLSKRKDPNTAREIVDMLGNRVTVPKPLERGALFSGPTGQIALILALLHEANGNPANARKHLAQFSPENAFPEEKALAEALARKLPPTS